MKALVLSSGGLDSTVCVGIAVKEYGAENVATLSAYYGQRHEKELKCAEAVAKHYGVPHYEISLAKIFENSQCPLIKSSGEDIPESSYASQIEENGEGAVATYVPFRNGLLLSAAASFAGSLFGDEEVVVMYGAHADDAAGEAYADCSLAFANAIGKAIKIGTYSKAHLQAPLVSLTKAQVVAKGLELGVPFELTWSCYKGGERQCGKCGTCIDRANAFEKNNVKDPVGYEGE